MAPNSGNNSSNKQETIQADGFPFIPPYPSLCLTCKGTSLVPPLPFISLPARVLYWYPPPYLQGYIAGALPLTCKGTLLVPHSLSFPYLQGYFAGASDELKELGALSVIKGPQSPPEPLNLKEEGRQRKK